MPKDSVDRKEGRDQMLSTSKSSLSKREVKIIKCQLRMAIEKRKQKFERRANHLRKVWKNEGMLQDEQDKELRLNMMFSNVEVTKPSVFFKNPRVFVKATQPKFILENGEILDGQKSARHLEDGANYVIYKNKLVRSFRQVRDDALITTYGVMMVGHEAYTCINEDGNEYIDEESIYGIRVSPYRFLVDPEATDCFTFKDAKWVAREVDTPWLDFLEDETYTNKDDAEPDGVGYQESMGDKDGKKVSLIDYAGNTKYKDSDDSKRIRLFEVWLKPTIKDRQKRGSRAKGKVVILSMSGKLPHRQIKWPNKFRSYPFRGLAFYKDNEEFYPVSDVAQYEMQMKEKDTLRSAQLAYVKQFGRPKILVNLDMFDSTDDADKLSKSDEAVIKMHLGSGQDADIRKAIYVLSTGSAPAELFNLDTKVDADADRASGINDMRRGFPLPGVDSATESNNISQNTSLRFIEKKTMVGEFFEDISRMIIQLIKQHWTTDTIVRRLGTLSPEWSDEFSEKDVQIEDDIEVDIGEMVPIDEMVRKQQSLEYMSKIAEAVSNDKLMAKLQEEGYTINISAALKEGLIAYGIRNDSVIERLSPDRYIQILQGLLAKGNMAMPEEPESPEGPQSVSKRRGLMTPRSILSNAHRSSRGRSPYESSFGGVSPS